MVGPSRPAQGRFATTRWSLVLAAGASSDGREALADLCEMCWYPIYAYVRRRGYSVEDAQDLTQAFFATLLNKESLARVQPERGRFRSFLLQAMQNFLANEWDRRRAQKRGGGQEDLSLDFLRAEERFGEEPEAPHTPESLYQRRWAMMLLDRGLGSLRRDYERAGRGEIFSTLAPCLTGAARPYGELARSLGMREGAVKVAVHRLRKRFGEMLRREIAETVENPEDVEDEMRQLLHILAS